MADKKRPVTFLAVGLLNTLLDFLFYTALVFFFFQNNEEIWIVGIMSGTFALISAFITHKLITWRDHPASKTTLIKFIAITGFGLWVIRPILLAWFITFEGLYRFVYELLVPIFGFSYDFVASTGAFGFMVVLLMIYNYFMYDKFVFKKVSRTAQGTDSKSERQ